MYDNQAWCCANVTKDGKLGGVVAAVFALHRSSKGGIE
jgi:hypothetical protein